MASNKKVIALGIDYSQLDGGTAEINRKMGLLEAQFRLAKEELKEFGAEGDELRLKQDKLTQQIILQTKKVELAKEAYDKAVASGKTTDKQLDNLQKTYINSQTQLQKLNNELNENKEKLDKANKSAESFGDQIRNMASTLGINVSPALEAVASKFDGLDKNVGNAVLGIGAIIGAFVSCTIKAADMADELLTLSSTTSITTDELQKLRYASDFLDVEVEQVTGAMTKLTRSMNDARQGTKDQEEAFRKLRVRYKDGKGELRDINEVFYEVIDALGKVKNETERDALAMELMGRSAKELNPLIEAGSKRLKELGVEAENMGAVMSKDSLEKLGRLKDAMDKLKNTTGALKNSLGLALLPLLTTLFEAISKIPAPVLQTIVIIASLIASIMLIVKAIKSVTDTASTIKGFFDGTNMATLKTVGIIMAVVAALIALVAIIAVLSGKSNDLQQSMSSIGNTVGKMNETITNVPRNTAKSIGYAHGTKDSVGGEVWVGEAGPELIRLPSGSRVYTNAESQNMKQGDTFIFQIEARNIKELNELVEMANKYRQVTRQGAVDLG